MATMTRDNLNEKSKKTIADYVGDIVAVESHIEAALDRQLSMGKKDATFAAVIKEFHDAVRDSRNAARSYQEQVGTTAGNPIIEKGADVLGAIAGMIDKIRPEGLSKSLRDDYTAFNLAAISYTMLHTTSMALGDTQTEQFAAQGLRTYARLVQKINHTLPEVVVHELKNDDHPIFNPETAEQCRRAVDAIWKDASQAAA